MEKIIDPIDVNLIKSELTEDRILCHTNKAGNVIYVVDGREAPNVLKEIGRLREIAFREAGGSSGLSMDLDEFDTMDNPYKQIIVWDPDAEAIIGGYRYILGQDVIIKENGQPHMTSSHMFHYSDRFISEYLPHTMELGRSFVAPDYQSSKAGAKAIFALDNLWDGIASIMMSHPQIFFMLGKMTIYQSYDKSARDLILYFLQKHFPDKDELVRPYFPVCPGTDARIMDLILKDEDFKSDYRNLKDAVRRLGTNIPPLVNSYMNTSPTLKVFGTGVNDELSNVEDTGILVCFDEMYEDKRDRHINALLSHTVSKARKRFPNLSENTEEKLKLRWYERRGRVFRKFKK